MRRSSSSNLLRITQFTVTAPASYKYIYPKLQQLSNLRSVLFSMDACCGDDTGRVCRDYFVAAYLPVFFRPYNLPRFTPHPCNKGATDPEAVEVPFFFPSKPLREGEHNFPRFPALPTIKKPLLHRLHTESDSSSTLLVALLLFLDGITLV